jgi:hypothetical protein
MAGALDTEAPFQHQHARQYAAVRQGGHSAFPSRGARSRNQRFRGGGLALTLQ